MKELILQIINNRNGIKAVDLVLDVMAKVNITKFDEIEYCKIINELIESGEIKEIEYFTDSMEYRVKSIYFTSDTHFTSFRRINERGSATKMVNESNRDKNISHK